MKKLISVLISLFFVFSPVLAASDVVVYSNDSGKFGLKDENDNIITEADYKKLIRLGDNAFIALKRSKYGLISKDGTELVKFKYTHAARLLGKYAKFKNGKGFGLYDEYGKTIIPQEQDTIDLLFGGMFLVSKDYKFGVRDKDGNILIDYVCDDIYMPKPNIMRVKYNGEWYEIEQVKAETLTLPEDIKNIKSDQTFKITKLVTSPGAASKYSLVTATDYTLKIFSSISPAYEATIDELMLSQGAEAISIFMKIGWLPKFPIVYAKNYFKILRNPDNGPLSGVKDSIKQEL